MASHVNPELKINRRGALGVLGGLFATTFLNSGCKTPSATPIDFNVKPLGSLKNSFSSHFLKDGSQIFGLGSLAVFPGSSEPNRLIQLSAELANTAQTDLVNSIFNRSSQVLVKLSSTRGVITSTGGLQKIAFDNLTDPTQNNFVDFPEANTFGGGALVVGSKLFVLGSRFTSINGTGANSVTYLQGGGQLYAYDLASDGTILNENNPRIHSTQGTNATGLALLRGATLVGVNSGDLQNPASLFFANPNSEEVSSALALGLDRTQLTGDFSITESGLAVFGSTKGDGKVVFADLDTQEVSSPVTTDSGRGATDFISGVQLSEQLGVAYVAGYDGFLTMMDLLSRTIIKAKQVAPRLGASLVLSNGSLLQSAEKQAFQISPF